MASIPLRLASVRLLANMKRRVAWGGTKFTSTAARFGDIVYTDTVEYNEEKILKSLSMHLYTRDTEMTMSLNKDYDEEEMINIVNGPPLEHLIDFYSDVRDELSGNEDTTVTDESAERAVANKVEGDFFINLGKWRKNKEKPLFGTIENYQAIHQNYANESFTDRDPSIDPIYDPEVEHVGLPESYEEEFYFKQVGSYLVHNYYDVAYVNAKCWWSHEFVLNADSLKLLEDFLESFETAHLPERRFMVEVKRDTYKSHSTEPIIPTESTFLHYNRKNEASEDPKLYETKVYAEQRGKDPLILPLLPTKDDPIENIQRNRRYKSYKLPKYDDVVERILNKRIKGKEEGGY